MRKGEKTADHVESVVGLNRPLPNGMMGGVRGTEMEEDLPFPSLLDWPKKKRLFRRIASPDLRIDING